jgi:ribonuclease HI
LEYHFSEIDFPKEYVAQIRVPPTPPWVLPKLELDLSLADVKKTEMDASVFRSRHLELVERYSHCCQIYTDGSKSADRVACAMISPNFTRSRRLRDKMSVFSAELDAILLALNYAQVSNNRYFVIYSDSKSSLQSLRSSAENNSYVAHILEKLKTLFDSNKHVVFCWVPSHVGIVGNEAADTAAKDALGKRVTPVIIPHTDIKQYINAYIHKLWQTSWGEEIHNKLNPIKPTIGDWKSAYRPIRREETVLCRVRIGHTRLTHSFIMKGEDKPVCANCNCPLTIKHLLVECRQHARLRCLYLNNNVLIADIFKNISMSNLIKYLKEIDIFKKL